MVEFHRRSTNLATLIADDEMQSTAHRTLSVSNCQSIEVSTGDGVVHFERHSWIPGIIHPLHFLHSDYNYFFPIIIGSFSPIIIIN